MGMYSRLKGPLSNPSGKTKTVEQAMAVTVGAISLIHAGGSVRASQNQDSHLAE